MEGKQVLIAVEITEILKGEGHAKGIGKSKMVKFISMTLSNALSETKKCTQLQRECTIDESVQTFRLPHLF